jgi:WD40 repeat protein
MNRWPIIAAALCAAALVCWAWLAQAPSIHVAGGFDVTDGPIINLAWSPDGQYIVLCGGVGCQIRDAATGTLKRTLPHTADGIGEDGYGVLGFLNTGKTVILPGTYNAKDEFLTFWNVSDGSIAGVLKVSPKEGGLGTASMITIAANGSDFAAILNDAQPLIHIFRADPVAETQTMSLPDGRYMKLFAMSPDGTTLAIAENDRDIVTYDTKTLKRLGSVNYVLNTYTDFVTSLAFSPDGNFIAAGFSNGGLDQTAGPGGTMITQPNPWPTQPVLVWHVVGHIPFGDPIKLCDIQPQGAPNMIWTANSSAIIFNDSYGATKLCKLDGSPAQTIFESDAGVALPVLSPDGSTLAVGEDNYVTKLAMPREFRKGK